MITILTNTTVPYEFKTKEQCMYYIKERAMNIKKSLRFVEKDTGHLCVRCPVSGDYLEIYGEQFDIDWLHRNLSKHQWYRTD